MDKETLGDRIFKLRKKHGMSQYQLAKDIGIHQKNIGKYERNEYTPSAFIVRDIAKVFRVTTDYLLLGSDAGSMAGTIQIKDKDLAQTIQELNNIDDETRQVVIGVLKLAIKSSKAKELLNSV